MNLAPLRALSFPKQLIAIEQEANRVFGSKEKASGWLNTPNGRLLGETSMTALNNHEVDTVWKILVQIDHGIYA
jgi:uncharacterized protein (DUF2384 family)